MAPVLKTGEAFRVSVGSNPTPSAYLPRSAPPPARISPSGDNADWTAGLLVGMVGSVSVHRLREPWEQPTAEQGIVPARRRLPPTGIIVVSILAVVVAVAALGFVVFGPPGEPSTSDAAARPLMVAPSASSESTLPAVIFTTDPGARGTEPPTTTPTRTAVPTTKASHSPKPPKTPKPTQTRSRAVRAGALCSPVGALGRNNKGLPMVCAPAADGRPRWRRL